MPRFTPSILISDCWGSVGDLTFYHQNGRCFYKKKSRCEFRGTDAQLDQADVHKRALAAWRELEHSVQLTWNALAKPVISHRPPFDRLIKIYLKTAEKEVLIASIEHFKALKESRRQYIEHLADKYGAESFLAQRISEGKKITYFNGVFELYSPYTIIEEWEKRLSKIES